MKRSGTKSHSSAPYVYFMVFFTILYCCINDAVATNTLGSRRLNKGELYKREIIPNNEIKYSVDKLSNGKLVLQKLSKPDYYSGDLNKDSKKYSTFTDLNFCTSRKKASGKNELCELVILDQCHYKKCIEICRECGVYRPIIAFNDSNNYENARESPKISDNINSDFTNIIRVQPSPSYSSHVNFEKVHKLSNFNGTLTFNPKMNRNLTERHLYNKNTSEESEITKSNKNSVEPLSVSRRYPVYRLNKSRHSFSSLKKNYNELKRSQEKSSVSKNQQYYFDHDNFVGWLDGSSALDSRAPTSLEILLGKNEKMKWLTKKTRSAEKYRDYRSKISASLYYKNSILRTQLARKPFSWTTQIPSQTGYMRVTLKPSTQFSKDGSMMQTRPASHYFGSSSKQTRSLVEMRNVSAAEKFTHSHVRNSIMSEPQPLEYLPNHLYHNRKGRNKRKSE